MTFLASIISSEKPITKKQLIDLIRSTDQETIQVEYIDNNEKNSFWKGFELNDDIRFCKEWSLSRILQEIKQLPNSKWLPDFLSIIY